MQSEGCGKTNEKRKSFGVLSVIKGQGMECLAKMTEECETSRDAPSFLSTVSSIGFPQRLKGNYWQKRKDRFSTSILWKTKVDGLNNIFPLKIGRNNMCDSLVLCQFYCFCPCCAEKARDYFCGTHCGGQGSGDGCCWDYWCECLRSSDCCGGTTINCCMN